ncbi:hypothetical protein OHB26_20195 [Nocardia sp. NBC_01503]|uniref:hypothetical protein n=1 Tax=Nocardia sp. NBC_01503 TaxID=2975997 RepID=UPI002E7AE2D0|nr:hypothetical protein [Nocardia sp. NBC_01503]WTL29334.1 hypothetical protein OHB26_20195 [Nocardia sp. NBC_01503]
MRIVSICAGAVVTSILLGSTTGVANAEQAEDHPDSCLVVANRTGAALTITLNYPVVSGTWNYAVDETPTVLADEADAVVTSPTGVWDVHLDHGVGTDWVYDGEQNTGQGCNGSWLLTVNA